MTNLYLVTNAKKSYSHRLPKTAKCFNEFLNEECYCGDMLNFPCPVCGAEDSIISYHSSNNHEVRGLGCEYCGSESNIREDLRCVINSILYYTTVKDPTNIKIANLLFDFLTEQMKYVKEAEAKLNH